MSEALESLPCLYRSDAIRAIERAAMTRHGIDEDTLMARAAAAAWRVVLDRWPRAFRIGVACGPGNNGGDGYVLATLARASGRDVQVVALPRDASRDTAGTRAAKAFFDAGGVALPFDAARGLPKVELWIDALFGIGLHRALEGAAADLVRALNAQDAPILALDVPSGIDADSGACAGACIRAGLTLSFLAGKCGVFTGAGRAAAGMVLIDRLGLDASVLERIEPAARRAQASALANWLPKRPRDAHKGLFGHVLCVGGDHGFGGAIALTAQAALRSGAGLVSVATRASHVPALLAARPEAMAHAVEDSSDFAPLLNRASVIAIGPGLGQGDWGRCLLEAALSAGKPLVVDADALNLLASSRHPLVDAVVTPHPGEAARLLQRPVRELEHDRVGSARSLADRFACTVVWKGAGTVVAAPGETPVIIDAGNPGMATGGMGDVLTGVIAALRAQGLSAFDAASCGALLHATAGDAAAADGGERGLLASDLFSPIRRLANPCI